jgi:Stage II sporulation protein
MIWLPVVSTVPVTRAAAAQCTPWSSTRIPPTTIRVSRTTGPHAGTVETVDFRTYVGVVLAAEWSSSWPVPTLQSGAVAIKEYAWYYVMNSRGYSVGGNCYDVIDNNNDQIYYPEGRTPTAGELAAIDATWYESITKNGALIMTGYRTGSSGACGFDADGGHLYQASSYSCAVGGMSADQILQVYYGPNLTILKPPGKPGVVFETPGSGNGTGMVTSTGSATVAWTEEPADGTTIVSRHVALQMAAAINGSCIVDRWLPASPAWSSTDASPQTASGLRPGFCYRFVVGLTDSTARTTYTASTTMSVDTAAPVATFTNPANGTIAPSTDATAPVVWAETSAPSTTIATRTVTMEYAAHPQPGSCAGGAWVAGYSNHLTSPTTATGLIHYYCYRWRVTLVDSAGHTGTWLSGILVEPAS